MRIIIHGIVLFIFIIMIFGCDEVTESGRGSVSSSAPTGNEWLISRSQVFDGGPGKDGIPSVDKPQFTNIDSVLYTEEHDLIIGIERNGDIKGYPHPVIDWHEIVNDIINDEPIAISYCPLTGSAIGWDRRINGTITTFGVSGLLYNTNLIPYDRLTQSNWSQMRLQSVNGNLRGSFFKTVHVIETTVETWKKMYPNANILSTKTGHFREYWKYPYGDYRTNHSKLFFPIRHSDNRLLRKQRVLGVIVSDSARAYAIKNFGNGINLIQENFEGVDLIIAGSSDLNFAVAYESKLESGEMLNFTSVQNELPIIMKDNKGNKWDIFGNAVEGPNIMAKLKPSLSFISYWFAWAAFYPHTSLN